MYISHPSFYFLRDKLPLFGFIHSSLAYSITHTRRCMIFKPLVCLHRQHLSALKSAHAHSTRTHIVVIWKQHSSGPAETRRAEKRLKSPSSDMFGWPDRNPLIRRRKMQHAERPEPWVWENTRAVSDLAKTTLTSSSRRAQHLETRRAVVLVRVHSMMALLTRHRFFPSNDYVRDKSKWQSEDGEWLNAQCVCVCVCVLARMWKAEQHWRDLSAHRVTDRETEKQAQWDMAPRCLLKWNSWEFQPAQIVIRPLKTPCHDAAKLFRPDQARDTVCPEIYWSLSIHIHSGNEICCFIGRPSNHKKAWWFKVVKQKRSHPVQKGKSWHFWKQRRHLDRDNKVDSVLRKRLFFFWTWPSGCVVVYCY